MPLDPEDVPAHPTPPDLKPHLDSALDRGMDAAFGSGRAPDESVIRILQARTDGKLGVHLPDSEGPGEAPVKIDEATRALRDANGRYQVVGEIARGGMGVVYKGRDADLGRDVAIKVLHDKFEGSVEVLERFVEEAQIGGQLQHPGIVPVYELGLDRNESPYFAMKLVKGETLAAQLARRTDPSEDRRRFLGVFEQICQTMAYAHARHVVHRDLKPANVMIGSFGEVQVVDWGFAKVMASGGVANERAAKKRGDSAQSIIETVRSDSSSGTHSVMGSMLGTPAYMPPEQATGDVDRMDQRSDVFGLGAILCEILTGQPPYIEDEGDRVQQAARGDTSKVIARVEASGANEAVIALCKQCLSPARLARPASAKEVADDIGAYLSSVEDRARAAEVHAAEARVRARSTLILSAVAILVLAVGGVGYYWLESEAAARRANAEGLVATALQRASARHGEAIASGFGDLAPWAKVQSAAEEVERLAASEFVSDEVNTNVAKFVRSTRRDHETAKAIAALHERDRVMRQALLEVRLPTGLAVFDADMRTEPLRMQEAYTAAFRTYLGGRKLQDLSVEEAATVLKGSALSVELAAALDHWCLIRLSAKAPGDLSTKLRGLIRRLDPDDEWRNRLRDLLPDARKHKAEFVKLAQTADFERLPIVSLGLLGHGLWQAGARSEAIAVYERARLLHPADLGLCLTLGRSHVALKNTAAAINSFRIAVALRPDMARVWYQLAVALHPGRVSDAIASLRRALTIAPSFAEAHGFLGYVLVAQGKLDDGIARLHRALKIKPNDAFLHANLGLALRLQGKLEEAIACDRRALKIDPKLVLAHHGLGLTLVAQGKLDEAIASFRRALTIDPKDIAALGSLGSVQFRQERYSESTATYRRLLAIDPEHAAAHYSLATGLVKLGKLAEAMSSCRRVLAIDPKHALAHRDLGVMLSFQGQLAEAIASLRRALAIDSSDAFAHFTLGHTLDSQGKPAEAVASYRRALEIWSVRDDAPSRQLAAQVQSSIERLSEQLRRRPKLLAIAHGESKAVSAEEWAAAADAAYREGEHVAATRTYTDAFAAHEKLLGVFPHRYNAACAAVLAATGQAEDGKDLAEAARTKLRGQAHAWLVAELEQENRNVNAAEKLAELIPRLQHWQKDSDLAGIRDAAKVALLPKDEAERWRTLWQDVQATLDRVEKKR